MNRVFGKGIALAMTAFMLLLGLSAWAPPAAALTQSFSNANDYIYYNSNWNGNREVWSPIYVNVGLAITRVDVQCTVWTNGNGNDASDVTIYVRHPDGTDQQLVWAKTYSGQSISTTFSDIFKFNGKLSTGQWNLRVRDENDVGANNNIGGYIDTWTLTIHYDEPSLTVSAPSAGQVVQGSYRVTASVVGAGIEHMKVDVDGTSVSEMTLSGGNYIYDLNTANYLDGSHTIGVTAIDWQGRSDSEAVPVQFDNVAPSVGFTQLAQNGFVKGKMEFLVAASNGESGMKVMIAITGPGTNTNIPMANLGNGYFGYWWDTAAVSDGDYAVSVSTSDSAGNTASAGPFALTVDNTPPVLSINAPTSGIYASGTIALDLSGSDANANHTQFKLDGGAWMPLSPEWTLSYLIDTTKLSDGAHRISARAVDRPGWTAESYVDITVNNANPVLSLVSPSQDDLLQGQLVVRARAAAFLPISTVEVTLDGVTRPAGLSALSGYYELPVDTAQYADGEHLLSASATEASGKTVAAAGVSFRVDNHAPTLGVVSPLEGQLVSGEVPLLVKASDPFLDGVGWWLDGRPYEAMVLNDTNWTASLPTVDLPEGAHMVSFRARDTIGHETFATATIIVDNSQPGVQLLRPAAGSYLGGKALFQVRAWDERGLDEVILHISGQPDRALSLNTVTGYYEYEQDTTAMSESVHSSWAEATDLTGKMVATTPVSFQVDNLAPKLELRFPPNGALLLGTDGPKTIDANATDAFLSDVSYSLDGGPWTSPAVPFTTGLSDGKHRIVFRAYDIPGKLSELTTEFYYDGTPPVVSVVSPNSEPRLSGVLKVAVSASDKMGIASVSIAPDPSTGDKAKEMAYNPSTGLYEAEFNTARWQGADRSVPLTVTAKDSSGYTSTASLSAFVDNTAPVITKLQPGASREGLVEFRFTVSDSSPVKTVLFRRDGGAWKEMTYKEAKGFYYVLWKTSLADNGLHTYEVKTIDSLGNERSASYSMVVENKDYGWVVWVIVVLVVVLMVAWVALSRRRKPAEAMESAPSPPPEAETPPVRMERFPDEAPPPVEMEETSRPVAPPPEPVKAPSDGQKAPSDLDKLVNDLTK